MRFRQPRRWRWHNRASGGGEKRLTKKQKCKKKNKRDIRLGHNYRHRFINGKCVKVPLNNGTTPPTTPPNSCNPYGSPGYLPCKLTTNITFTVCPPSGGGLRPDDDNGPGEPGCRWHGGPVPYPEDKVSGPRRCSRRRAELPLHLATEGGVDLSVSADFSGDAVRNPAGAVSCSGSRPVRRGRHLGPGDDSRRAKRSWRARRRLARRPSAERGDVRRRRA